jgi:pimeloyl-ACP methyl ester carboxylesterase
MKKTNPVYGVFPNGIPFVRLGSGTQSLLLLFGGPGNNVPKGMALSMFTNGLGSLLNQYCVYILTRKSNLPESYTIQEMAADYAELIRTEFGGKVDLIIGMSYGGTIAIYLAKEFPDLFRHLVIAMAAHQISPEGKALDLKFAELMSKGKKRDAYKLIVKAIYPAGLQQKIFGGIFWLLGNVIAGETSGSFAKDVMVEAQAEMKYDASKILPMIHCPMLIIDGDRDFYFPLSYLKEMASQLPQARLIILENRGHDTFEDKRFSEEILAFVKNT